jgi:hypothetical protein
MYLNKRVLSMARGYPLAGLKHCIGRRWGVRYRLPRDIILEEVAHAAGRFRNIGFGDVKSEPQQKDYLSTSLACSWYVGATSIHAHSRHAQHAIHQGGS